MKNRRTKEWNDEALPDLEVITVSSQISLSDQFRFVSNSRLRSIVSFGIEIAKSKAESETERAWVSKLEQFEASMWPGIDFDMAVQFPTIEEKKFWAGIFGDVAQRIFLRELGNQSITNWQASAIGDTDWISLLLTGAVQQVELGWHPRDDNGESP